MQEQQGRMLTWMAGALVVLVGVVVLGERDEDAPEDDEAEVWTPAFADLDRADVTTMTITSGDKTLTLERADDGWRLSAPITATADSERITGLLGTLETLECGEDLEADNAADFGLAPPAWSVSLTTATAPLQLRIGAEAPVGGRTYVQCSDDAVRTTQQRITESLSVDPSDFRSRAIARFPRSAMSSFSVEIPVVEEEGGVLAESAQTDRITAQRAPDGWRTAESGALLDTDKILAMADAMVEAEVGGFDSPPPMPPFIQIEAIADGQSHILQYGINGTARVPLQDAPVTFATPFPVPGKLSALLSSALMSVDASTLSEITVSLGEQTLSATRDANGWTQPTAEAVLAALMEVRVDRTIPAPPVEGSPWGTLQLADSEGQVRTVSIYQEVEGQRVVWDPAGGPTFLLPATELSRLLDALGS